MMLEAGGRSHLTAALWSCACAALAVATWLGIRLGLDFPTAAFVYLTLVVVLSLFESVILALAFPFAAAACLGFFFTEPAFSLDSANGRNVAALAAFCVTSIIVAGLAWRLRSLRRTQLNAEVASRSAMEEALTYSEHRYYNLFQAMAASFWEIDFSAVTHMLRDLRAGGVTDFRTHFAANPEFVRAMMRNSRVIDVNDQTVALFGQGSKQEMLDSVEPFWPEESTQIYAEGILSGLARKPHYSVECTLRRLDGTKFDALFTAAFPPKSMEKGTLVIGVIDITDRKKSEEALRLSEYRYRNMFQALAASFWELDFSEANVMVRSLMESGVTDLRRYLTDNPTFVRDMMRGTRVVDVNEHTVALFGGSTKQDLSGNVEPFWPDESTGVYAEAYLGAVERKTSFSTECKLRRIDGRLFDGLFTVAYPSSELGRGTTMVGVIDITARKEYEVALRASEQRYQNLFQAMAVSFWELDFTGVRDLLRSVRAQGISNVRRHLVDNPSFIVEIMRATRVVDVNDRTIALFGGRNKKALLGTTEPMWPQESWIDYSEAVLSSVERKPSFSVETRLRRLDGSLFDAHFTVWYSPDNPLAGLAGVLDVTERNRAQEMLQRVQADFAHATRVSMLGELTASIAHEVNQPLAAIAANGEAGIRWLARSEPDVGEVRDLIRRIVADARRAADIIARVRTMASRRQPERTSLLIDDVVREALMFLRPEVQSRGVVVTHYPARRHRPVFADRTQLQQVIVNLTINAMQAMAQSTGEKRLYVRTIDGDGAGVICSIEDNGPGIAADHIDRLFDSFFTTKEGGMGMGLPICRSIIEAHDGRITVANIEPNGGARFTFTLPAAG